MQKEMTEMTKYRNKRISGNIAKQPNKKMEM